jgi:hypothetical protein
MSISIVEYHSYKLHTKFNSLLSRSVPYIDKITELISLDTDVIDQILRERKEYIVKVNQLFKKAYGSEQFLYIIIKYGCMFYGFPN